MFFKKLTILTPKTKRTRYGCDCVFDVSRKRYRRENPPMLGGFSCRAVTKQKNHLKVALCPSSTKSCSQVVSINIKLILKKLTISTRKTKRTQYGCDCVLGVCRKGHRRENPPDMGGLSWMAGAEQ